MKRILLALFCLVCCGVLLAACAGCGPEASQPVEDAGAPPSSPPGVGQAGADGTGSSLSGVTSEPGVSSAASEPEAPQEQEARATVGSIDVGTCYLRLGDGREIAFPIQGVDTSQFTDTFPDSEVIVYYTGDLAGSFRVTRLVSPAAE